MLVGIRTGRDCDLTSGYFLECFHQSRDGRCPSLCDRLNSCKPYVQLVWPSYGKPLCLKYSSGQFPAELAMTSRLVSSFLV